MKNLLEEWQLAVKADWRNANGQNEKRHVSSKILNAWKNSIEVMEFSKYDVFSIVYCLR